MNYLIKAPNEKYTGKSAGVNFVNGVGLATEKDRIEWFKENGYEVEKVEVKGEKKPLAKSKDDESEVDAETPDTKPEEKKSTRGKK